MAHLTRLILVILVAVLARPFYQTVTVLGFFRKDLASEITIENQAKLRVIPDTIQCEDLHYWASTSQIFAACENEFLPRFTWFPPVGHNDGPPATTGSIYVINPKTMKSTRLIFENFSGPFVTHGIDIIADPEQSSAVYIFAVNHLGNPDWTPEKADNVPAARSQIEVFHHVLNSQTIRHVRSVRHPLIATPNDIYAQSPRSFWVTNDHAYRLGFLRHVENLFPFAFRTNVIHVQFEPLDASAGKEVQAEAGVDAIVALKEIYNNNGMGHGRSDDEILITSCMGGFLYRTRVNDDGRTLSVVDTVGVESTVDNPSYYADPYASPESGDASGYLQAGLRRAVDLVHTHADPTAKDGVMIWYLRQATGGNGEWEKRLLFEDDGSNIRAASAAVLVPIEPARGDNRKEAWLFVSGFISKSVVALKVEL